MLCRCNKKHPTHALKKHGNNSCIIIGSIKSQTIYTVFVMKLWKSLQMVVQSDCKLCFLTLLIVSNSDKAIESPTHANLIQLFFQCDVYREGIYFTNSCCFLNYVNCCFFNSVK